ncbi:YbhB/YbcL family Raf kinase inhibitor-like protein [Pseudacidovorax sp. NFM-22]|uniref:YbhB/YbcL family Raf kinase inhibitor-like protein n=1 Tax=Pseudacidovorax sp. NFM-22 TaxID=2744469 RepID=UPI001F21A8C1|nr:YbhB/YbcL family Raf kinase inhibitor-like protein [Pseudacidovorax sp. NFM-22]
MLEKLPGAIGQALAGVRAGLDDIVFNTVGLRAGHGTLQLTSLAFGDHAPIPQRYTADGEGFSPPLAWTGVPAGTAELVLIVEDADSPTPHPLVHAIAVGLPPEDGHLAEGAWPSPDHDGLALHAGRNSYLQAAWLPPDPPPGHGPHRYAFQLYALAEGEALGETPGRDALVEAIQARAVASGLLIGTYERGDGSIPVGDAPAVAAG